jgi:hypothetical protein
MQDFPHDTSFRISKLVEAVMLHDGVGCCTARLGSEFLLLASNPTNERGRLPHKRSMSAIVVGRSKASYGTVGVGALGHHGRTAAVGNTDGEEEKDVCNNAPSSLCPYDVLCGRSTFALSSVGNRRFRITVALALPRYRSAPTRVGRTAAIASVVDSVHESGGRFLRRRQNNSRWIELDDKQAREKVGHALREVASTSSSSSWVTSSDDDGAAHRVVHSQPFLLSHGGGDPSLSPPTVLRNLSSTWTKEKASPWPPSWGWNHGGPGSSSIRALDAPKSSQHGSFLPPETTRSGGGRRDRLHDHLFDEDAAVGGKRNWESPPSASGVRVGAAESDVPYARSVP